MRRAALLVLLLTTATAAGRMIVSFSLKKDPHAPVRVWALHADEDGFAAKRVGRERRFHVRWNDIVDEDRERIRRRFGLDGPEDATRVRPLSGHRLHFHGGGRVDGLLERVDAGGRHWVRRKGVLLPYPGDRVARVEDIRVPDTEVFGAEELYARRIARTPPRTAEQHRAFASHLLGQGSYEKAAHHYKEALRLKPAWHAEVRERLAEIDALAEDAVAADLLRRARSAYRLRKDFDGAARQLRAFAEAHPDRARLAARILDDLEAARVADKRKRFTAVKNEEFVRVLERYLRTKPDLQRALAWVRARAEKETRAAVATRLGLTADQVETFLQDPPAGATHWCTYEGGSFIFSRRAEKGKTTRRAVRGDPDAWWEQYSDIETRSSFLRAYGAERLARLFEVVQVKLRDCGHCGGTGIVRHVSVKQLSDGRHEWKQVCPRCYKARWDRSVGYR